MAGLGRANVRRVSPILRRVLARSLVHAPLRARSGVWPTSSRGHSMPILVIVSKRLEVGENGAKERSACVETPCCLRNGTTRAQNSQREERMSSALMHAKFPVRWLMSKEDEREPLAKSEDLCRRGAVRALSGACAGEDGCFLRGSKGRICG